MSSSKSVQPRVVPSFISYPEDLPITEWRNELLDAINRNQVVVVVGETGSGKSTQLPKMCLELGRGAAARIGHTQPRRIAARSIAERVATELGSELGGLVGYTVRFTDRVADSTAIKVMTDGILLNEIQHDRELRQYDTVIVDEAHERSLNIDFLLGYLALLAPRRPDLRVIITSATIDAERFSEHFGGAPIVEVAGRSHPVEIRYRPLIDERTGSTTDQTTAIGEAVNELVAEGPGDVLVFCSGEREIRDAVEALEAMRFRHTEVVALYGRLSAAEQHRVFASHTGRRIVVATNVAETSLTVPGIRFVVDTGYARVSRFSKRTKVQQLPIEPISQASARQRAGRCGRLGPGVAIRLYDQADHDARPDYTDPEILRTSLASVLLRMAAAGLGSIEEFPFLDAPDARSIKDGVSLLVELGAVDGQVVRERDWLTPTGERLARMPLDPRLGRMVLAADTLGCLKEVLTIVSALAIQDPRERPRDKEAQADQRHAAFVDPASDFLSWLKLWRHIQTQRKERTSSQFRRMCRDDFLNWRRVREWQDLRSQLRRICKQLGMRESKAAATPELVHEALLHGLLSNVGQKSPDGWEYRGARGARFSIRPGSALFKRAPEWIMAAELVDTTRTWATGVAPVDPATIEHVAGDLVHRSITEPWWDAERGTAVAGETATLFGLTLSSDRTVMYERVDPVVAREMFIRHALVLGEWNADHAFVDRNRAAIASVIETEERERRFDLLVDDDTLVRFFEARLPDSITSTIRFDAWWRTARPSKPALLDLTDDVLIDPNAAAIDEDSFPTTWHYGDLDLDLSYEFDPSSESDGVTIDIPIAALDRIDPQVFDWNVPGLRVELVTELLRSLPKPIRRQFTPIADSAGVIAESLEDRDAPLLEALAVELTRRSGSVVRPDAFDLSRVPPHVRPRFRVVDTGGRPILESDDLQELRTRAQELARAEVTAAHHPIERSGIVRWDFEDLPGQVVIEGQGQPLVAFPSLIDDGDSVSIRLLATSLERDTSTWDGLRRLVLLQLPSPHRLVRTVLADHQPLPLAGSPYSTSDVFVDDVLACAIESVLPDGDEFRWTRADFDRLVAHVRERLGTAMSLVGTDAVALLESIHRLHLTMERIDDQIFGDVLDDVDEQLDRFLFPGCLAAVGASRVPDLVRYVDAAAYRLERLTDDPIRDRDRMSVVRGLEAELDELTEVLTWSQDLIDLAWMMQEFRVSLFAETLGVKTSVSEKRIRNGLQALLT